MKKRQVYSLKEGDLEPLSDVDDSLRRNNDVDREVVNVHQIKRQVVDNLWLVNRRYNQSSFTHNTKFNLAENIEVWFPPKSNGFE